jgi:lysozyme
VRDKLISMLKRHEGVETHAYKCSENKTTIGVGRNVDKGGGLGLSDDEVDYLLQNDIDRVVSELDSEYDWFAGLDSVRQDALIDISFNLGQTRLRAFKNALAAMAEGDWGEAADQFMDSRWSGQVGKRSNHLTDMIRTGAY